METKRPATERAGEISCDEPLFEKLRILRKELADQHGVPPYIIFGDNSLRQMARQYPQDESEFRRISGVGEQKLRSYGEAFLSEIAEHLKYNPRQMFADSSFENAPVESRSRGEKINGTTLETLRRFRDGAGIPQIASERGLAESTIYGHLASAAEAGETVELAGLFTRADLEAIAAAFARTGLGNITGAIEELGGRYNYGQLKVYRAVCQQPSRRGS